MIDPRKFLDRLPDFTMPTLTKDAEIAVYMVHNSRDAEDYFFLFDFEEFVSRSKTGYFVRPSLRVFAGRDDFSRSRFAHEFRAVFSSEFNRMRAELATKKKRKRGWLDWNLNPFDLVGSLVSNLVLATALSLGKSVFSEISLPRLLKGKSLEAKLSDEIDGLKSRVEAALERQAVTLHPELYEHAYRDGRLGPNAKLDREAWPLPDYVRQHLDDRESGSWW